jgi:hypothetical protein
MILDGVGKSVALPLERVAEKYFMT